ncbi:unnamed protein product [Discosporangium mesarthrocarpum]
MFQQTKFVHGGGVKSLEVGEAKGFRRLDYPVQGSFRSYLASGGVRDADALSRSRECWGANVLDIPMPSFGELFTEHAVAPFFVFQVRV